VRRKRPRRLDDDATRFLSRSILGLRERAAVQAVFFGSINLAGLGAHPTAPDDAIMPRGVVR
jgi:hypothetical protein